MWKNQQGMSATYRNLLELFETAGHSQCAEIVIEMLRKKSVSYSAKSMHPATPPIFPTAISKQIIILCFVISIIAIVIGYLVK